MATYTSHKTWLEAACGPADGATPVFSDAADFVARNTALDQILAGIDKSEIQSALRDINLSGAEKIKVPFLADPSQVDRPMDVELDSHGDRAERFETIGGGGQDANFKSADAAQIIQNIQKLLEPIYERSRQLAAQVDADGNRVFSDRDIEKELWSPLVREGIIPSNIVPDAFSETVQVFRQGTAVYDELMEREEGRQMSPDGVATALRVARHVVKIGKLAGSEALHYVDVNIQEASRLDFAKFAAAKNKLTFEEGALGDMETAADIEGMSDSEITLASDFEGPATPENIEAYRIARYEEAFAGREDVDIDQLRKQGKDMAMLENIGSPATGGSGFQAKLDEIEREGSGSMRPLDLVRSEFSDQAEEEGGNTDYADWLSKEEDRLDAAVKASGNAEEKAALKDRLNAIQGARLTHEYADHVQHQAALNIAATVADSTLKAAEQARDKRQRRDAIETVLTGAVDVVTNAMILAQDPDDLTLDRDTLQMQHEVKYGSAAAKGAIRGINKLSQALVQPGPPDSAERRSAIFAAVAEFLNAAGEGVGAMGHIDGGSMDADGDGDSRDDAASYALIGKSAAIAVRASERIMLAYKRGDTTAIMAELGVLASGGVGAFYAGQIGDITRKDSELEDIKVGLGDKGLIPEEGVVFATNPFEEVRGAAGQTAFGMSGDLATVADQRAVLEETDDLVSDLEDASKAGTAAPKILSRLGEMETAAGSLAGFSEGALLRELLLIENAEDLVARQADIKTVLDAIARAASQAEDQELVNLLSDDVDKDHMNAELDSLRALIADPDSMDADAALAHFNEIRDEMLKDERVLEGFQDDLAKEDAELEALKARADLTRLDTFTDPEEYARERDAALNAIQQLTQALKAAEKKAKMIDTAIKTGLGTVLAAVPGAGLAQKIRALIADSIKASKRTRDLSIWKKQMEAMSGNYSVYEYAASGEKQVLKAGQIHDRAEVVADLAGAGAELLRLLDHTHMGAAGLTTIEKSIRCLNEIWFTEYSEARIRKGWKAFQDAVKDRGDRRKARAAIELNTTLGKCVLAYGACIDGDPQARAAMQACGLTPEVLASRRDVCQAVVDYLRARLDDSEFETIADHDAGDWLPCPVALTLKSWVMIKAAALNLNPPLDQTTFASPELDRALAAFEQDPSGENATALKAAIAGFGPKTADKKPHLKLTIVLKTMAIDLRRHLPDPPAAPAPDRAAPNPPGAGDPPPLPPDPEAAQAQDRGEAPPLPPDDNVVPDDAGQAADPRISYLEEIKAAKDLKKNNCLINAMCDSAGISRPTDPQLVEIRSSLGNVGEMMYASQRTVSAIKRVMGITETVKVFYISDPNLDEVFPGSGGTVEITHSERDKHFSAGGLER